MDGIAERVAGGKTAVRSEGELMQGLLWYKGGEVN